MGKLIMIKDKVKDKYLNAMIALSLLLNNTILSYAKGSSVTTVKDLDDAVEKTKDMIEDVYKKIIVIAVVGAVLAIAVIKCKGIFKASFEENYIRDVDSENKKVRVVIIATVIAILAGPLVNGVLDYFGYVTQA